MNEFIQKLVIKEANSILNEALPDDMNCGEADASMEDRAIRFKDIAYMSSVTKGEVTQMTASDIEEFNKKIMILFEDEVNRLRYNSKEYLSGILQDKQDEEEFNTNIMIGDAHEGK